MFRASIAALTTSALALILAGCIGGGGGTTPTAGGGGMGGMMNPAPGTGGGGSPTPPVTVSLGDVDISSIHLEFSDRYRNHPSTPARTSLNITRDRPLEGLPQSIEATDYSRDEAVCPGIPPNGNKCTYSDHTEVDGTRHKNTTSEDRRNISIDYVQETLTNLRDTNWSIPIEGFGGRLIGFTGQDSIDGEGVLSLIGARGKHMAFATWSGYIYGNYAETQSMAFGNLYSGRPTAAQGGATWSGIMFGAVRDNAVSVEGTSRLVYDFADNTLDLHLENIEEVAKPQFRTGVYNGPSSFTWNSLRQNDDGSFYIPGYGNDKSNTGLHSTLGYVDGDFYGPNAEEFAGVFEREGVVGSFGGHRQSE